MIPKPRFILLSVCCLAASIASTETQPVPAESAPLSRQNQIRAAFNANSVANYANLKDEIAGLIRIDFNLSPQLLLPGEEVTLSITARTDTPPKAEINIWQNCYNATPEVRNFDLVWERGPAEASYFAAWTWTPPSCGNYLVHWQCDAGGDIPEFWRNFSVVDRGWAVMILNSTSHIDPRPEPEFHRLHLPFSYWAESLLHGPRNNAETFAAFSRNARQYGDDPGLLIFQGGDYFPDDKTVFYDEPEAVQRTVLESYRELWGMFGFPAPLNSLYTYGIGNLPVNVARETGIALLGALCADQNWADGPFRINHWGMPARPYFVSSEDFRKAGPGSAEAMVGVQQCERHTMLCRDYHCVYAFEPGVVYALDQYSGINRPRIVDDMLISRELDFFECFLDAASQADHPYLFSCGVEFNGVWPEMAAINTHFLEYAAKRAQSVNLAFTTASTAAEFLRRHEEHLPESTLYLPDVFAGMTAGNKPPLYPDTMEIENAEFRAIFRRGEILPCAQYDYTVPWKYPDWDDAALPRRPDGYLIPDTDDRFRVRPAILDTRAFQVSLQREERDGATHVRIDIDAEREQKNIALALWDIPRACSEQSANVQLTGAKRFVPIRAAYTGNCCGILIADVSKGVNHVEMTFVSPPREPQTLDFELAPCAKAKVFERNGVSTAYLFNDGSSPVEVQCGPPAGASVELRLFDSDEAQALSGPTKIILEPGKSQRLSGLSCRQLLQAFPDARPIDSFILPKNNAQ